MAADGRMQGRKNASRKNHCPRLMRLTTMAKNSGRSTSGGVLTKANRIVCHIADQNRLSPNSSR